MQHVRSLTFVVLALLAPLARAHAQRTTTVSGSVTDATSRRSIEGVTIQLGDNLIGVSDRRGEFRIKAVPAGTYGIRVTRIGYRPKNLLVPIDLNDRSVYLSLSLEPLPVQLEPVVIRGDTTTVVAYGRRMADFYRRRHEGFGRFFTRADLERRHAFRVTDLLRTVPGAWINYDWLGQAEVTFRGAWGVGRRCQPAIYIDGMRMPSEFGSVDVWVLPDQIQGMEVYSGLVMTPLEFSGGCGAIVIWTG